MEKSSSEWITGQSQRVYCASKGDGGTLPGRGSIPTRGKEHEGQVRPRRVETRRNNKVGRIQQRLSKFDYIRDPSCYPVSGAGSGSDSLKLSRSA